MIRLMTLPAICLVLLTACGNSSDPIHHETEFAPVAVVARIDIARDTIMSMQLPSDASQSYALYVPKRVDHTDSVPCIIFFDPHGAGGLPLRKYQKLADEYGVILTGSNNSKNGIDLGQCSLFANNIISDLTGRIGVAGSHICLAGFSGGAKVALSTAANNTLISKVIYAGAVVDFQPNHSVTLLGFAGQEDMNYSDLVAFAAQTRSANHLIEFKGKHEWPDVETYRSAFEWVYFAAAVPGAAYDKQFRTFTKRYEADIAGKQASKRIEDVEMGVAQDYGTEIFILSGVADTRAYQLRDSVIRSGKAYKELLAQKNQMLQNETNQKQILIEALQKQDGNWWTRTINGYRSSTAASDKRLLGFVSLACYSYSSQLIARNELAGAEHFLAIYELADPDNTDQLYFHAVLYARQNDKDKAISYLTKAVGKGFNDWRKIEGEPAFITLQGNERFSHLLASLKNSPR